MTEILPDVTPERTYALLVGIEQYDTGLRPLPGAAADALGHAQWLIDNDVPPDHIRLCVSPLDTNRDHVRRTADRLGIVHHRAATERDIREVLAQHLPAVPQADLLWLTWSGHGLLPPDQKGELLPFADGLMAMSTDSLRDYLLHNPAYDHIARKVLLYDACRVTDPRPHTYGWVTFPGTAHKPRRRTELLSLHATQSGSAAYSHPDGGGLFTRAFLAKLNAAPGWPPDPAAIAHSLRDELQGQRLTADTDHWSGAPFRPTPPVHRPDSLPTHTEALTRLGAKGKFLTDTRLPYLPPDAHHETSPARILARLTNPADSTGYQDALRGILLTGPAGTGKTRTCLEVARHALDRGWQVFHPRQDEGLRAEQLLDGVREAVAHRRGSRVLLVLDYLDRYHSLDLRDLATLLHAEAEEGLHIACVAAVRPGARRDLESRGSRTLFAVVDLRTDETRRQTLARHIFKTVAPKAWTALGDTMADLCTTHPVLALLLSLELEQLAADGTLDPANPDVPRPGALIDWFDRRTREDLGPADDVAERLAATAAALTCVHTRDAVEKSADTVLRGRLATTADGTNGTPARTAVNGAKVVARLKSHGWLLTAEDPDDPDADLLDTIHDIVTDLFLGETCLLDGYTLDPDRPGELLDALHPDLRTLRRAVGHLNRWGTDLEGDAADELARACSTWLGTRQADILTLLRTTPDEGARTLITMISALPWRRAVVDHWDTLVTPWLAGAEHAHIRAFLTDAALNSAAAPAALLRAAHDWLTRHIPDDPDAVHLINALAHATTGHPDHYEQYVAGPTRDWLHHHGLTRQGRIRIHTLLRHTGHRPDIVTLAVHTAVEVAHQFRRELADERLLSTLLRAPSIPADHRFRLAEATHDWLVRYAAYEQANYLLRAALDSPQLADTTPIATFALEWLHHHGAKPIASYVLHNLLKSPALSPHLARRAVAAAHTWLAEERNASAVTASFVLAPLLYKTNIEAAPEAGAASAAAALAWLEEHPDLPEASFVLIDLLRYQDHALTDPDRADVTNTAITKALAWLSSHETPWERHLLQALLARRREMTPEQRHQAVQQALERMRKVPFTELRDSYVFRRLLPINGLPDALIEEALQRAQAWLQTHADHPLASFVLAPYLLQARLTRNDDALKTGVTHALRWLETHGDTPEASYVIHKLHAVRHTATDEHDPSTVARLIRGHVLRWVQAFPASGTSARLLAHAVGDPEEFGDDGPRQALDATRAWLAAQHRTPETSAGENLVLSALLTGLTPGTAVRAEAARHARDRLDLDTPAPTDDMVLRALLHEETMTGDLGPELIRAILDWMTAHGPTKSDNQLLTVLLRQDHLPVDTRTAIIRHTMNWLGSDHGLRQPGALILENLITALQDTPPPHPDVVPIALEWLRRNGHRAAAKHLLRALADHPPAAPHREEIEAHAARWLTLHPDATDDIRTYLTPYLPGRDQ
ncbi:caspase family protein [Streptomyces sp. NPDC003362]